MKNTLILIFALFALSLYSQTTTKAFVLIGQNYYEVTRVTQDDGAYTETASLIGPANALTNDQADKIEQRSQALAQSAFEVSNVHKSLKVLNDVDSSITVIVGAAGSPLRRIQDRYIAALTAPGWTINQGAGFVPIVFSLNAQGNLRYNVNGTGNKNATIYGKVLRLKNFPQTGTDTDFFESENGQNLFSIPNRSAVIKLP